MNKTILIFLVFIFVLSFGLTYSVNAADLTKEWKCGSGLTCGSDCQGVSYKPIGGTNDPEFTFSAEPGIYSCDITIKNTWFAFTGDTPELNEYSDVYLNDVKVGNTDDLFCNAVGPAYCGDDDCEKDAGGNILETDCPQDCCSHIHNENDCINFAPSVTYQGTGGILQGCYWHSYTWYGRPGGICRAGGGFDISPAVRVNKGCNYYSGQPDSYLTGSYSKPEIDCCSCYYHSRWNGYCGKDYQRYTRAKQFPDWSYDGDDRTCLAKSPKYCTDVTYFDLDCGKDYPPGTGVSPTQATGPPECEFGHEHTVLVGTYVNGGSGIKCKDIYQGGEEYVKLLAFLHFEDPENLNYICCFGHKIDDGLYCVRNEECKNGDCINNVCGGGGNGDECDYDGNCEAGETHANCPSDCECDTVSDCVPTGAIACTNHECVYPPIETHNECIGELCKPVSGPGPNECDTDDDCKGPLPETVGIEMIIIMTLVGLLAILWNFLIRKNLTYLYELFKMNAGRVVLVLFITFALSFSVHFSLVNAADLNKEWSCGSGFSCSGNCDGNPYKPIGGSYADPEFAFTAEAGIYNCDLSIKNTWFAFTGDTPELNEYSDVKLNSVTVGNTDDLFCNAVTNGNGDENPCKLGLSPAECNAIPECEYQYYNWYDVGQKGRCAGKNCAPYPHSCTAPSTWDNYAYTYFSLMEDLCCSCWTHGAWCGSCDPSRPADQVCRVKSPKYCGDINYNERYCEQVIPGSGVQCEWDHNHKVMVNDARGRKPEHTGGVECGKFYMQEAPPEYEKYKGIIGMHHFGTDQSNTDYICCFAKSGTLIDGQHCVRDDECKNGDCINNVCGGGGGDCVVNGNCEEGETHANCPDDCDCDTVSDCLGGAIACTNHVCIYPVETHWICKGMVCEEVSGPGPDECTPETEDADCGYLPYAGGDEPEGDNVYFGLTFNGFNGNGEDKTEVEGEKLSFASGCTYCGDVIKTIHVTGTELKATDNKIKLEAHDSHGLRYVSITCTKLDPPVADAGPDQAVNLTGPYVTVSFNGLGSYDPDGYIVDYKWNFSDGYFSGNNPTPTHNYYEEGVYKVTLNVTDNDALKDSDYMMLYVNDIPTITDDYAYDGVWVNSDQTVTLTAQDSSGIDRVKYCYGVGCDPASGQTLSGPPYTLSFTVNSATGIFNRLVRYRAWDIYNNPSDTGEFRVKIDKRAPVTTDDSDTETHGNNYAVTLTCTDGAGSGCDKTYYCVSPNGSNTCNPTITGTNVYVTCGSFDYCEKVIKYYSVDKIANTESTKTSNVIRIDTRIPTCDMGALNQYTTTMSIGLNWSGEDPGGSGVTGYRIHYKEGSGSWDVWDDFSSSVESGTFTDVDEGKSYYFRCQAKSAIYPNGGSYSSIVSTFVDATPPTASMAALPAWANQESFPVSWSGDDSGSGVKDYDIQYSTSPPPWTSWLSDTGLTSKDFGEGDPLTLNDGTTYHFRVRASDNAGLQGTWSSSESIGIDLTPPTCSIADLPDYVTTSQVTVSWSGDDSGSGVKDYDVDYSTDDENWVPFVSQTTDESKTETLMDSEYYFRCRARDVAVNVGDWSGSEGVSVDTRAPGADVNYTSPVLVGKNITVNATLYDVSNITNVTLRYGDILISEVEKIETYGNRWDVFWTFPVSDEYGPDEFYVITEDIHGNSKSERYSFNTVLCEDGKVRGCGTDIGECIKGNQTCIEGIWGECLGGLSKRLEVCDNKDNDCNGLVDDGIQCSCVPGTTRDCGTDTGECQLGTQSCTADQVWGSCVGNYVGPVPEVCDGKDNDCDGQIDNGANCCPEGKKRPCGFSNLGICKLGQSQCLGGVWGSCIGSVMPEQYDICDNGLDDDCDGEVDEGCALCSNNEQDEGEEGVDCGGPCPPCPEFPWFILSIIGVIILIVLFFLWKKLKEKGEELTWENMKKEWTPA